MNPLPSYHEKKARGTFDFPIELYWIDADHPRYEMPFHWHMESELILVLRGVFRLALNGEPVSIAEGESAFIPAEAVHGGSPQDCVYECLVFDMDRFLQESALCRGSCEAVAAAEPGMTHHFSAGSGAGELIRAMFRAMREKQPGYELTTAGLLWQFMGLVLRERLYAPATEEAARRSRRVGQIKEALRRIRADYAKPLTLGELAAETGMVPRYFCRVFREVTGRTPIDYLNYYRVERAAELLCDSPESVTEIALSCGFDDPGYFTRTFRRYKGCTASGFRKAHQTAQTEAAQLKV